MLLEKTLFCVTVSILQQKYFETVGSMRSVNEHITNQNQVKLSLQYENVQLSIVSSFRLLWSLRPYINNGIKVSSLLINLIHEFTSSFYLMTKIKKKHLKIKILHFDYCIYRQDFWHYNSFQSESLVQWCRWLNVQVPCIMAVCCLIFLLKKVAFFNMGKGVNDWNMS